MNLSLTKNQRAAVLKHLVQHGSIEHNEAREKYGCAALRSRIAELRREGYPIGDQWVKFTSMYGHKGACKRYVYQDEREALQNA